MAVTQNGKKVKVTTQAGDDHRTVKAQAGATPLDSLTLPQALNWIDSNVNNLADARAALKILVKLFWIERAESGAKNGDKKTFK